MDRSSRLGCWRPLTVCRQWLSPHRSPTTATSIPHRALGHPDLQLNSAASLLVTLRWNTVKANVDLAVTDPNGFRVAKAQSRYQPTSLDFDASVTGAYSLTVSIKKGSTDYTLSGVVTPLAVPSPQPSESPSPDPSPSPTTTPTPSDPPSPTASPSSPADPGPSTSPSPSTSPAPLACSEVLGPGGGEPRERDGGPSRRFHVLPYPRYLPRHVHHQGGDGSCNPDCGRAFKPLQGMTMMDVRCDDNDNQCAGGGIGLLLVENSELDHNGLDPVFLDQSKRSAGAIKRVDGDIVVRNAYIHTTDGWASGAITVIAHSSWRTA